METKQPHLLVVDDEQDIRQILTFALKKSGYRVSCAENAAAAFSALEQETCDVVVSDVMMPGEDGITFLGRVHHSWPEIPVILMTGYAQLQMAIDAIKNGAFDFIHKPFDIEYLHKIIARALNYSTLLRMEKNYRAELEETVARRTAELTAALAELDFARAVLLKSATEKSEFMATISREMRTPMNDVVGALELLASSRLDGDGSGYLAMARRSADNMLALIGRMQAFGGSSGHVAGTARYDLIDPVAELKSLVATFQADFSRKALELDLRTAAGIPRQLWADRECLNRLLGIVIGNALKFTDQGGVTVEMSPECADGTEDLLRYQVSDSGIGIPEGMLERIFEPFVQGEGTAAGRRGGAGLGLAIARQHALLLGGNLWAEHVPGGGSRFSFTMKAMTP